MKVGKEVPDIPSVNVFLFVVAAACLGRLLVFAWTGG
jgi:hypothetical protein